MIEEDDNNWDDTGFSKIELEDILNEFSDIYVSNNPYEKIRKRKAYLIEGLIAHGSIYIFYGDPKVGKKHSSKLVYLMVL